MFTKTDLQYICINCGTNVTELYKMYSPSVLKLTTCEHCDQVCDKYIEYDPVIIMIDLVLLRREAYRHFLYNTEFKNFWKLIILIQLMEAFSEWMFKLTKNKGFDNANNLFLNQEDLQFYIILLKIMLSTGIYNIMLFILTRILNKLLKNDQALNCETIVKCYTISSFGKFFLLPALIWADNSAEHLNLLFVFIYTSLCQFLVFSVVSTFSMLWSIILIIICNYVKILTVDTLNDVVLFT